MIVVGLASSANGASVSEQEQREGGEVESGQTHMEDARERAVTPELDLNALRERELDEVERLRDGCWCEIHGVQEKG